nr:hypothetical protein [Lachnospiraceae bacterium]
CVDGNTQHAVTVNDDGYTVEASFAWTDIAPEAGQKIGIDLQINDGKGGARIGTVNWYDASGNGWSSPAVFGEAVLAGQDTEDLNIQYIDDAVYTGSKVTPKVVVRAYGKKLVEGTDYTLTYSNNVNVAAKKGTGLGADFDKKLPTVTIKGKGNYAKSVQANFSIVPADVAGDGFEFTAPAKLKQSGKATTPAVTVKFNGKKLAKKDYATKYALNDGAEMDAVPANASNKDGVYYAVIKGQGNFKGTTKVALNIPATDQVAVSSLKITLPKSKAYTGSEITLATKEVSGNKAELIVKDGSKVLEQVSDNAAPTEDGYKVQYEDNIEPGLAKVTIIGNGPKYVGSVVKTFTIKGNVPFAKAVIAKVAPLTYTGEEQMINPKVTYGKDTLELNKDYTIELVKGGTVAGAATYKIAGKGKYDGAKNVTVKINKAPASSVKVDDIDAQPYAVAGAQPEVTVKFGDTVLVKGKDYTVSYKNNKKIGKDAVATITLKGNFAGKTDKKFEIVAGKIAENATMTADDVVIKNGKYQTKVAIVDPFGKKLVAGKDYDKALTYSYYDGSKWVDVDAKTDVKIFVSGLKMKVTAKGIGSYQDNISAEYRLVDVLMKSAKVKIKNKDFNGKAIDLTQEDFAEISIKTSKGVEKLKLGEDFTIKYLDDHTSQGTHKIEIVALECKDHNIGGFKAASFKINKKTMKWSNAKEIFNKIQSYFE